LFHLYLGIFGLILEAMVRKDIEKPGTHFLKRPEELKTNKHDN
jgi:hypothetical protein